MSNANVTVDPAKLSPGAKNIALCLAHGKQPPAGVDAKFYREAHHAGIIGRARGPVGDQWQVSILGIDMLKAMGSL